MKGLARAARVGAFALALTASAAAAEDNYTFDITLVNSTTETVAAVCDGLGARSMGPGEAWRLAVTGLDGTKVSCYAYDHHGNQIASAGAVMDHHHLSHRMAFTRSTH